jgi:hypothetical protein
MVLQNVMSKQIPIAFDAAASILSPGRAGKVRAIALTQAAIRRPNDVSNAVIKEVDFVDFLRSIGGEPAGGSADDSRRSIAADVARGTLGVREAGVQPE